MKNEIAGIYSAPVYRYWAQLRHPKTCRAARLFFHGADMATGADTPHWEEVSLLSDIASLICEDTLYEYAKLKRIQSDARCRRLLGKSIQESKRLMLKQKNTALLRALVDETTPNHEELTHEST